MDRAAPDGTSIDQVIGDSLNFFLHRYGGLRRFVDDLLEEQATPIKGTGVVFYQPFSVDTEVVSFSDFKSYISGLIKGDVFAELGDRKGREAAQRNLGVTLKKLGVPSNHNLVFAIQELAPNYDHFVMSAPFSPTWYFTYVTGVEKTDDSISAKVLAKISYFQYDPRSSGLITHFDFKQVLLTLPLSNREIQELYLYQFPKNRGDLEKPNCSFEFGGDSYELDLNVRGNDMVLEFSISAKGASVDNLRAARDYVSNHLLTANYEYVKDKADQRFGRD